MNRRSFFKESLKAGLALGAAVRVPLLAQEHRQPVSAGPLKVHPGNPRYFSTASGEVIYLSGSHTWPNLVDMGPTDPPESFDFGTFLDRLNHYNHNFMRLWTWESSTWPPQERRSHVLYVVPQRWKRTGPGIALDGKPKFNLKEFDERYFERLRNRVRAAGELGIYVSVMLFEGFALQSTEGAWESHPFHPANNINLVAGDLNLDGRGEEVHTLQNGDITRIQESYVRHVVDTVNSFDNVLFEICNEAGPSSGAWQYHMIDVVRDYESRRPKQHPVGMTFQYPGGSNETLMEGPADWVSPNAGAPSSKLERLWAEVAGSWDYRSDPPPADGSKVIISDSDHLWGIGGNQVWVWKSFLRGLNTLFMEPYDGIVLGIRFDPEWEPVRRSLGYSRRFAERIDLATMVPRGDLSSTKYCLARPGFEYLTYLPRGRTVSVNLRDAKKRFVVEWFDPNSGAYKNGPRVEPGAWNEFHSPFPADVLLYLYDPALSRPRVEEPIQGKES